MQGRPHGHRIWAWLSALTGVATLTAYLVIMAAQGTLLWEYFPWALLMALGTAMAVSAGVAPSRSVRRFAAITAAVVFGVLGVVAIFSIGLGLLLAAGFAAAATQERREAGDRTPQHQP